MSKVSVSVIVPVYNTAQYLPECLESLLSQDLKDFEIICVDNGSSDNSLDILKSYRSKFENIYVLEHCGGLQGGARNVALSYAKGEYIGFVDSDDFVRSDMFSKLYKQATQASAEIAISNIEVFFQFSNIRYLLVNSDLLDNHGPFSISDRPQLLRNLTICNKIFSADLLRRLNLKFPDGLRHEDQYFVATSLLASQRIVTTPEALYSYRKEREGSVSSNIGDYAMDIFPIMALIRSKHSNEIGYSSLLNELFISRCLQVYGNTNNTSRNDFFKILKSYFTVMTVSSPTVLLTHSEYQEYQLLKHFNYYLFEFYIKLRTAYGFLRRYI